MNVLDLIKYVGRYVRTEDPTRHNCGMKKDSRVVACHPAHMGYCGMDDLFGGEGWVVGFSLGDDGTVSLCTDEGMSWIIGAKTVITQPGTAKRIMDEDAAQQIRQML